MALLVGLSALGLWGCRGPSDAERRARLSAILEENRALNDSLDAVELRLMGDQTMVVMWQELGQRHRDVSELACHNLSGHLEAVARFIDSQEVRTGRMRTRVVAEVDPEVAHGRRSVRHW
jgi:hypothetical protein